MQIKELKLNNKELSILKELKCYTSKFECAKNDVGTDFLQDYYNNWENLKLLFEDWALDNADYYFEHNGLHFICRMENIEFETCRDDVFNLLEKVSIKNIYDFYNIKNRILYKTVDFA